MSSINEETNPNPSEEMLFRGKRIEDLTSQEMDDYIAELQQEGANTDQKIQELNDALKKGEEELSVIPKEEIEAQTSVVQKIVTDQKTREKRKKKSLVELLNVKKNLTAISRAKRMKERRENPTAAFEQDKKKAEKQIKDILKGEGILKAAKAKGLTPGAYINDFDMTSKGQIIQLAKKYNISVAGIPETSVNTIPEVVVIKPAPAVAAPEATPNPVVINTAPVIPAVQQTTEKINSISSTEAFAKIDQAKKDGEKKLEDAKKEWAKKIAEKEKEVEKLKTGSKKETTANKNLRTEQYDTKNAELSQLRIDEKIAIGKIMSETTNNVSVATVIWENAKRTEAENGTVTQTTPTPTQPVQQIVNEPIAAVTAAPAQEQVVVVPSAHADGRQITIDKDGNLQYVDNGQPVPTAPVSPTPATVIAPAQEPSATTAEKIPVEPTIKDDLLEVAKHTMEKEILTAAEELETVIENEEQKVADARKLVQEKLDLIGSVKGEEQGIVGPQLTKAQENLAVVIEASKKAIEKAQSVYAQKEAEAKQKFASSEKIANEIEKDEKVNAKKKVFVMLPKSMTVENLSAQIKSFEDQMGKPGTTEEAKAETLEKIAILQKHIEHIKEHEIKEAAKVVAIEETKKAIINTPKTPENPIVNSQEDPTKTPPTSEQIAEEAKKTLEVDKKFKEENPAEKIPSTPESIADYKKFLQNFEGSGMGRLAETTAAAIPGFNELPEGQKMMILQGLNDSLLTHVREKAITQYDERLAKQTGWFGKTWTSIRKRYLMAKFSKKELELIKGHELRAGWIKAKVRKNINTGESKGARLDFINQSVPGLMQVFGNSGIDAYLENGKVVTDFANRREIKGMSSATRELATNYNKFANILAHTPQENKGAYEKAEKKFNEARDAFLVGLEKHAKKNNVPNPGTFASEYVYKSEILMHSMSFLAADQNASKKLVNMALGNAYQQSIKDIIAERGLLTVTGGVARTGIKAIIVSSMGVSAVGVATGAVVLTAPVSIMLIAAGGATAGVIGYFRGRQRAKMSLEEQDKLARKGKIQKGETVKQMGDIKRHVRRITEATKAIESLNTQITGTTSEVEKKKLELKKAETIEQLRTVSDFAEAKLQLREMSFGKNKEEVFINQNNLMKSLHKARAILEVTKQVNMFSNEASGAELGKGIQQVEFNTISGFSVKDKYKAQGVAPKHNVRQRVMEQGAKNFKRVSESRKSLTDSQAFKSGVYGTLFGSAGATVAHFAEEYGFFDFLHHHAPAIAPTNPNAVPNMPGSSGQFDPSDPLGLKRMGIGQDQKIPGPYDPSQHTGGGPNTGPGTGNTNPAEHPGVHHGPGHHTKPHVEKVPTNPAPGKSILEQASTRPVGIPSENELGSYKFTNTELTAIAQHSKEMLNARMNDLSPEMTKFIQGQPADDLMDYNSADLTNQEAVRLLEYMKGMQNTLGTHPNPGESVQQYLGRMIQYKNYADVYMQLQKGMDPFNEFKTAPTAPQQITDDEIMRHKFTPDEESVVKKLQAIRHHKDTTEYFDKHPRWENKSAEHLMDRNEDGIWNPAKQHLDDDMLTFAQQTGHNPDDMTVQQYTEFMEWYNARKDFLNGAYSQQEIDAYDAANPAPQPIDATETITNNTQPNAAPTVESINNIVTLPKGSEDWYENSLNEYFEANPKVWENMQNLELRYVISNNDRFLDANLAGNPLALNFRSALIQYLNENKMSIGRHETLRDFMRDLALRQKDGGVTFKDMLLGQTVAPAATPTPDLGDALYNNISDETVMAAKPAANIANAAGINATGINPTLNQQIAWANVDEANKILEANTPAAPSAPVASPVTLETEPNLMSNDSVLEQANIDEANRIIREGINNAPTAAPIIEAAQEKAADYGLNSFAVNANNLTVNQMAWVTENASELLNETALTGGAHMQDMITKFGFDTYVSQFQNKTIEEVLSASRPTEGGEFYDLISNLAKANPDLAQEFPNVNNFLLQSYVQDEKLHLAMEAVPTPKPVAPVLEEVGNDATPY